MAITVSYAGCSGGVSWVSSSIDFVIALSDRSSRRPRSSEVGNRSVLWTCSISALFAAKHVRGAGLPPGRCGNGHELTPDNLCPMNGVPVGAAANAGLIAPLIGVASGRPRLSAQVTCGGRTTYRAGVAEREGARGIYRRDRTGRSSLARF
jgi:hypothetical protein